MTTRDSGLLFRGPPCMWYSNDTIVQCTYYGALSQFFDNNCRCVIVTGIWQTSVRCGYYCNAFAAAVT